MHIVHALFRISLWVFIFGRLWREHVDRPYKDGANRGVSARAELVLFVAKTKNSMDKQPYTVGS